MGKSKKNRQDTNGHVTPSVLTSNSLTNSSVNSNTNSTPSPTSNTASNLYDVVEYLSYPYKQSQPEHLYTLGRLFGLQPKPIHHAKVLELGCASGGNLYPLAESYPLATFIGVDNSQKEIEHGTKIIQALNLNNIQLKKMDILDIQADFGKFDYIICHGVFSWVESHVQEKILKIFHQNLTKNGIAYISYNTYPGWNLLNDIREMMLYHTRSFTTPEEKVSEAKGILKFMVDGLEEDTSPYARFLRIEANSIYNKKNFYLFHDFLEKDNTPVYFYEMVEKAATHHLSYLSDTDISTMHPINLNEKHAKSLAPIKDLIKTEQYMDFIRNRRFRCSLFCHDHAAINRRLEEKWIESFLISTPLVCERPLDEKNLAAGIEVNFKGQTVSYKTSDIFSKWVLKILIDQKRKPISISRLVEEMAKKIPTQIPGQTPETIRSLLESQFNLNRLFLAGIIHIHSEPDDNRYTNIVPANPESTATARLQSKIMDLITNMRHEGVRINFFERLLLPYLDGQHSVEDLVVKMQAHVDRKDLKLQNNEVVLTDKDEQHRVLTLSVNNALQNLANNALIKYKN